MGNKYYYFKKRNYSQKTLNLVFYSIKKRYIVSKMRLKLTNIVVVIFDLLLVLLNIINIRLIKFLLINI